MEVCRSSTERREAELRQWPTGSTDVMRCDEEKSLKTKASPTSSLQLSPLIPSLCEGDLGQPFEGINNIRLAIAELFEFRQGTRTLSL